MIDSRIDGFPEDPCRGYAFRVEIDGLELFAFKEVSGLSNKTDVFEYQEGGENGYTHKLVGQTTFTNLILKNGIILDSSIYEWRELVINGNISDALRTITITLEGAKGKENRMWNFYGVWPCKWESSKLDATSSDLVIETLELVLGRGDKVEKS